MNGGVHFFPRPWWKRHGAAFLAGAIVGILFMVLASCPIVA